MTRRVGQKGQISYQGRSHDAQDCGTYVLVQKLDRNQWRVKYVAECCALKEGTLRFVSMKSYARYF